MVYDFMCAEKGSSFVEMQCIQAHTDTYLQ